MDGTFARAGRGAAREARRWRRTALVAAAALAVQGTVGVGAARAAAGRVWTPANSAVAAVKPVAGSYQHGPADPAAIARRQAAAKASSARIAAPVLPAAGSTTIALGASPDASAAGRTADGHVASPSFTQVGSAPVYLSRTAAAGSPSSVSVDFAARSTATAAGVDGLLFTIKRADGISTAGPAKVEVDTPKLAGLYGGDYAQRLEFVSLPACAMTTPDVAACRTRAPLAATQDTATGRLSTAVSTDTVVALTSAPAGSAGTYNATSVKASDQWSAGGATGDFSYTYPVSTPHALGGTAPSVTLAYSSSSVDGETVSTNAQASWVGDGWAYNPGFIERSYQPCSQDGISGSGDECWAYSGHEITASGSGIAGQVVWSDTANAFTMGGSGATIKLETGANNGAYDGEYWVVTDIDGTRYYYGAGKLPSAEGGTGGDVATNSVFTEPVYCPNTNDGPTNDTCHNSTSGTLSYASNMAYRWNLDYVVDPHGNTTVYTYQDETGYYARDGSSSNLTSYTRGGYLQQISYGWRTSDIVSEGAKPAPADEIRFTVAERCTASSTTCTYANLQSSPSTYASDWPDSPIDLMCTSTQKNCLTASPTYWSTKMLTGIETYVNEGSTSSSSYMGVDDYTLSQSFPDPGDGTSPALRLDSILHQGVDASAGVTGGTAKVPVVQFLYGALPNRVPGSTVWPAFNRFRITAIDTESGGTINVNYTTTPNSSIAACDQTSGASVLPTPSNDNQLCYQEYWTPPAPNNGTIADWFEKYVVSSVAQTDPTGGSPEQVTKYSYIGTPAWHRNDSPFTQNSQRTWDDFRGFQQVATSTGTAPDPITYTLHTYLRGMNGDYESQSGGTQRSVSVTTTFGDTVTDSDWLAGRTIETQVYSQAGGTVQQDTEFLPWSHLVASHAESGVPPETAYFTGVGTTKDRELLADGQWRTTATVNVYSQTTGQVTQIDNQGDLSLVGTADSQETCQTLAFATPPSSNSMMQNLAARATEVFVTTAGPIGTNACPALTSANAVSDVETVYDGQSAYGVVGSVGDVTAIEDMTGWSGSTEKFSPKVSAQTYDAYGRVTSSTDDRGNTSTTTYSPATETPPTSVVTDDVTMGWSTSETLTQARGLTTKSVDQNGVSTSSKYDGLGRLLDVWLPGRSPLQSASREYMYSINGTASPSWVASLTLRDDSTYGEQFQIYDGFMQVRQVQRNALDGSGGSLVSDTFYNTDGLPSKTSSDYDIGTAPSATLYKADDSTVPDQSVTTYDGRGRIIDSATYSYSNEQWDTKTSYPGADRTDITPPKGGKATSSFTDAEGVVVANWTFNTGTVNDSETYTPGAAAPADVNQITYTKRYIAGGSQATTTDASASTWAQTYNYSGNEITETDPDTGSSQASYDAAGDVLSTSTPGVTAGAPRQVAYSYDALGRQKAANVGTTSGPKIASWTYDSAPGGKGYLASSTSYDPSGLAYTQTITGYNDYYKPTGESVTVPTGLPANEANLSGTYNETMTYTANLGLLASTTYDPAGGLPGETVKTQYTDTGIVDNVSGAADYLTGVTVDPWGRVTRADMGDMPNQFVVSTNYDTATGHALETFLDPENMSAHLDDITSTWDASGQITSVTDAQDGGASVDRQCYTYNGLGQLSQAWTDTAGTNTAAAPSIPAIGGCDTTTPSAATIGGPAPYWQSYSYTPGGDRASETDYDTTGNAAKNLTQTETYPSATGTSGDPDEVQSIAHASQAAGTTSDSYSYNADGSVAARTLASGPSESFTYNAMGQAASTTDSKTGNSSAFLYDASGNLMLESDTVAGTDNVTLYLPGEQLTLNTSSGAVTGERFYNTGAVTEVRSSSGTLTYQVATQQGTATVAVDASTLTPTRRYYNPYGEARGTVPTNWIDNLGFQGKPTDSSLGVVVLGQRLYDPSSGSFLERDPVFESQDAGQIGGYSYAGDDPVNGADPNGTMMEREADGGGGYDYYPPDTDSGSCATATCAAARGNSSAAAAAAAGCIVTCPDYSDTITGLSSDSSSNSVSVTTSRQCRMHDGGSCKSGTATATATLPKYLIVNGTDCTTSQCVQQAISDFESTIHSGILGCASANDKESCVASVMQEASTPVQVTATSDKDYTNLGLQPPCHGFGCFMRSVTHIAGIVASVTSVASDILGAIGGITALFCQICSGIATTASVGLGLISAGADVVAGHFEAAGEELMLTGISAASGGLGKAGEMLEKAKGAVDETHVLSAGLLGGFMDARAGMPAVKNLGFDHVGLAAAKLIGQVPSNALNVMDGNVEGWGWGPGCTC